MILFYESMRKCIKQVFNHSKVFFKDMILVEWKYAKMHQYTFLTTPDVKKSIFKLHDHCGLEVFENALKHVFNHSKLKKSCF
jgi:hypothetical protein